MPFVNEKIKKILDHYKTIWALYHVTSLAHWDLNTYMPDDGVAGRGEALAKISTLSQKIFLDKDFVELIGETEKEENLNDAEKGVLRTLKRDLKNYQKLPPQFLEEFTRVTSEAHVIWRDSKRDNNFGKFAPSLEKIVDLNKKKADYLGYEEHPYDALINEFEEGWTTRNLDDFFSGFCNELKEILDGILSHKDYFPEIPLETIPYDKGVMEEVNKEILRFLNAHPKRLRLDASPHPFTSGLTNKDVRITTWYGERDFGSSVTGTIHEFGHALYDLQVDDALQYTPIGSSRSLSLHESQSRFWENMVGRSRAFTERFTEPFKGLSKDMQKYLEDKGEGRIHRYFNRVKPSPIRVEADEVTYHFHVMLRYDIEKGLMEENLKVKDLPEIWNASMEKYLGLTPQTDSEGVLQDIHWSMGAMGYFPTYSIGTFLSAIWREALEKEFGDFDEFLYKKESIPEIQKWLKEKIHRYGSTYTFKDLVEKSLNKDFSTRPMLDYLKRKYLS